MMQGMWALSVRTKCCQVAASAAASPLGWNFRLFRHVMSYTCANSVFGIGGMSLLSSALTSMTVPG